MAMDNKNMFDFEKIVERKANEDLKNGIKGIVHLISDIYKDFRNEGISRADSRFFTISLFGFILKENSGGNI